MAFGYSPPNLATATHTGCGSLRALACFARDDKFGTDPNQPDSDADGPLDGAEVSIYATNPALADTDLDRFSDGAEVAAGTDPLDPLDFPGATVAALGGLMRIMLALGLAVACRPRARRG